VPAQFIKKIYFSTIKILLYLCQKLVGHIFSECISGFSIMFQLSRSLCQYHILHSLIYWKYLVSLKAVLTFFLLYFSFKKLFSCSSSFVYHINYRIFLFIFKKNLTWILISMVLYVNLDLWTNDIFIYVDFSNP
jgi:hypothetical protein